MTDLLSRLASTKITFGSEQEAERDIEIDAGLVIASLEGWKTFLICQEKEWWGGEGVVFSPLSNKWEGDGDLEGFMALASQRK